MVIDRRFLLKGMALGSAALTLGGWGNAAVATAMSTPGRSMRPTLALTAGGAADALFLQGARTAAGTSLQLLRIASDADLLVQLRQQLEQPLRIIGLLDDATGTVTIDLARSAGARMRWLGEHSLHAGASEHHVLEADRAAGCVQRFSALLQECGGRYTLTGEQLQGSRPPDRHIGNGAGESAAWLVSLGYLLAGLDGNAPPRAPLLPAPDMAISGSFVSFSLET